MMFKYLIKNNSIYIFLKIFISLLLMLLVYMQNYFIFFKIDQYGFLQSFNKENQIQFTLIPSYQGENGPEMPIDKYEEVNKIYHKLKNIDNVYVNYVYHQNPTGPNTRSFVMIDKDYYIREYDNSFQNDIYPCVLKPKTLQNLTEYDGMPVVGTTEKYEAKEISMSNIYDPATDIIILIDDIYIFDKDSSPYFMIFTDFAGGSIDLSIVNEDDYEIAAETAYQKINDIKEELIKDFKAIDINISFYISSLSSSINNVDDLIFQELDINRTRNIAYTAMFVGTFLTLAKYFIFNNTEYISLCLFLGKTKKRVVSTMMIFNCLIDFMVALIFYFIHGWFCPDIVLNTPLLITLIMLGGIIILDAIVIVMMYFKIDSKKMLLILRTKEAD